MAKKVLILGAGYGGIFTAANLCKSNDGLDICLLDKNPYHQLLQQIPGIIYGKPAEDITVRVDQLFESGDLTFIQTSVQAIDLQRRIVVGEDGNSSHASESHNYDYLVIALGASNAYFGVKGAKEYAASFRSVEDAIKLREKIDSLSSDSVIAICGGGPTAVSLAAALSYAFADKKRFKVKILEASQDILAGWDPRLADTVKRFFLKRGIEVLPGRRVKEITPSSAIPESSKAVNADLIVWTAGVRGYDIKTMPDIKKNAAGRITVNEYSQIPEFDNAFAIGDISEFRLKSGNGHNAEEMVAPQLAQFAVRQARFVAMNILHRERGEPLDKEFSFAQRGHTISLGSHNLGLLEGLLVSGMLCEYAEDSIVDNFVREIKNKEKGISAKAVVASESDNKPSNDLPPLFDFKTYATSQAFLDLVR